MCKFCENITEYSDLAREDPYLVREKPLPFGEDHTIYKIIVPAWVGKSFTQAFSVDDITNCPYCGRELEIDRI